MQAEGTPPSGGGVRGVKGLMGNLMGLGAQQPCALHMVGIILIILSIISILKVTFVNGGAGYIYILLSLELLLLGISLIFISSALFMDDMDGIMTALYILTLGAAESAIGLCLITANLTQKPNLM